MTDLQLRRKVRLSPKQRRVLEFRAPHRDGEPQIEICGILGEYGGGKTYVAALRFLAVCHDNPFEPGKHSEGNEPLSGIVAPTFGDLLKGALVEFRKICPDELIFKERLYGPEPHIQLTNGHKILLYSAEGAMNGPTLCQIWADEIQERIYDGKWDNIQGRVRDKRAQRLNVQASGIAQRGHVETIFRRPNTENRLTVLLFPEDNVGNMAKGYQHELRASQPASRERDPDGWMIVQEAMYPKFSRVRNLRMPPGMENVSVNSLRSRPTSFAVDLGAKAAVVFGQPCTALVSTGLYGPDGQPLMKLEPGLLLVAQFIPDNMRNAEQLAKVIKQRARWNFEPGISKIFLDPTAEPDQVVHFRNHFPGVEIIQIKRGFYHKEDNGVRAVDRAILDGNGDVRLFIAPTLEKDPSGRGVVEMFSSYLLAKPKDKKYEHAADVVRYMTQWFLRLPNHPLEANAMDDESEYDNSRSVAQALKVSDL